jgi:hypothetical protein
MRKFREVAEIEKTLHSGVIIVKRNLRPLDQVQGETTVKFSFSSFSVGQAFQPAPQTPGNA